MGAPAPGSAAADFGLQPGQTVKQGDWKCGSCGNIK